MGGVAKQLLDIKGAPLLARVVDAVLASGASPVVVVLGADLDRIRCSVEGRGVILAGNPEWREGLSTSIRVGIAAALRHSPDLGAVLLTPCDLPALGASHVHRLAGLHASTGRIACARFDGRNASPAIFGREHFQALLNLSGDQGARGLLNGPQGAVQAIDFPELAADLDTRDDYEAWSKNPGPA